MLLTAWTCACGSKNRRTRTTCAGCGTSRQGAADAAATRACRLCGGSLRDDGLCLRGGGYPMTMACPFVCPVCRQRMQWDGGCNACHGTPTVDRAAWTFVGDRYELEHGHYRLVARTETLRVCTPDENAYHSRELRAMVARIGAALEDPIARAARKGRDTT
jgi:hypothetical protein